jgi:hypothetical protein
MWMELKKKILELNNIINSAQKQIYVLMAAPVKWKNIR